MAPGGPIILVVDDDASMRRLVRTALELEGFDIIEAATVAQARSVGNERVSGVVLDRHLPDGDGLEVFPELAARWPTADVILHSAEPVPDGYPSVAKGDVVELIDRFGAPGAVSATGAPEVARAHAAEIVAEWIELCRWDPELPAESRPPVADSVVGAVASALARPQPVGWGLDPALETVAETYRLNHDALDVAVAQLVCLREAFDRKVIAALPADARGEAVRRLTMITERLMVQVVRSSSEDDAFVDPVTRLGNGRAYAVDLRRELARAERHRRPLSVARVRVEGLDLITGGDDDLRAAGLVLRDLQAYRVGPGEFAVLFPDEVILDADFLAERLSRGALVVEAAATATYPHDPLDRLDHLTRERLRS
jgi:CheY-like chemotaxis protein/GGDEF domain-containing protein